MFILKLFISNDYDLHFTLMGYRLSHLNNYDHRIRLFSYYLTMCCYSVAKLCLIHCNLMEYSLPDFPVLHYLLEFALTHVC